MEFQQENDLWQRVQNETNPMEQRLLMVEMVKLLLEKADMEPSEITLYDRDELTDLFLEYQEAGGYMTGFFEKALPNLDPEYKGKPFETQLQQLQEQISTAITKSETVLKQLRQWQDEEKNLNTEIERLETIQSQADILERNIKQLGEYNNSLLPNIKRYEQLESTSQNLYEEIQKALLDAIPRMIELLKENFDVHREHFDENEKIREAFAQVKNLPDLAANTFEINKLSRNIDEQLQRFDDLLATFIRVLENHLNQVKAQREI